MYASVPVDLNLNGLKLKKYIALDKLKFMSDGDYFSIFQNCLLKIF
jgi:hypothetical protein